MFLMVFTMTILQVTAVLAVKKDKLDKFVFKQAADIESGFSVTDYSFKGYTNHWDEFDWKWYRYAGILSHTVAEPRNFVIGVEDNIGVQLMLEELWMQKGFVSQLARSDVVTLISPTSAEIDSALSKGDVFVIGTDDKPAMEKLLGKVPEEIRFRRTKGFYLENNGRRLFVISSHTKAEANKFKGLIENAIEFTGKYKMYKGLAGTSTGFYSIWQWAENPIDLIAKALNLRNSWVLVTGNDWIVPGIPKDWLESIKFDYLYEFGESGKGCVMYGMKQYPQVQDNTTEDCIKWTKERNGYIFGRASLVENQEYDFDGYLINSGNKDKIEETGKPFITGAGALRMKSPASMVVLLEKNAELNKQNLFDAILSKRAVAVFGDGTLAGPREYVEAMWMLILDREYLEQEFAERADVAAKVRDEKLIVSVKNNNTKSLDAELIFDVPAELTIGNNIRRMPLRLNGLEQRTIELPISYTNKAAGKVNPIVVVLDWGQNNWKTITYLNIPNPIEIHDLLLVNEGKFSFPVTVWNCGKGSKVDVKIEVFCEKKASGPVLSKKISVNVGHSNKAIVNEELSLKEGVYVVKVSALGYTAAGQISVKKRDGMAGVHLEDMNNDGVNEIVMENKQIRATVMLTGGRVVEYILKSKNENLFFKLWPETPPWHDLPKGRRKFYPQGGLEEFIGYPTIEGHVRFKYKILKESGSYVSVKVWANIHGSIIEKIFTLYGDSTVLETRYAFREMDSNLNIIGINPQFQLGHLTGLKDRYYFPVGEKIVERTGRDGDKYGNIFDITKGWVAGEDAKKEISLAIAYPVDSAVFMHYWRNNPQNTPTPYYYTELQPWMMIKHGTTTYFTYYILGCEGRWQNAVEKIRKLGLETFTKRR